MLLVNRFFSFWILFSIFIKFLKLFEMNTNKLIVIFFLLLCFTNGHSQHTLCGKVTNQKGEPLYPANIKLKNSTVGTSTENDGSFCINISANGEIKISFVGYETTTIKTNPLDTAKVIFKTIVLKEQIKSLPVFEVSAKNLITVTKEKNIFVRDYEFMGNNILTLSIKGNERKLSLITLADSLIWETNVSEGMFRCTKFYKDFQFNTFLLSDDSAFQITNKDKEIYFFEASHLKVFNKMIVPSLAMCNKQIVYRIYGPHNKSVYYMLIKDGKEKLLFSQKDTESEMYCNDIKKVSLENPAPSFANYQGDMRVGTNFFNDIFYNKIMAQPIEIHLFKIQDNIYIFDHFGAKMYVYNCDAKLLKETVLYYPKRKDIVAKQLILVNNQKDVYAVFNNDGIYSIQQIDLETGKLKGSETKINYPFVEKIRIYGNHVYFLYKQKKDDARKLLYKIDL